MALITLKDISMAFGGPVLLDKAGFTIEPGERICLVGRNGCGKSTLLNLIHGGLQCDSGTITREQGVSSALLPQEVPMDIKGRVYDVVASGQPRHAALLSEYQRLSLALAEDYDDACLEKLNHTQHALEVSGAWALYQQVHSVITRMGLDGQAECSVLSAGVRRRVYLARAILSGPEILLLDEPTNHLDIDTIVWMEEFLLRFGKTMLFVSHDRAFIHRIATRIVELDRGRLTSFAGDYTRFLDYKRNLLENEERQNAEFDKKRKKEEVWIRQGVKARRTRNEGRVRALMEMRAEVQNRRGRTGSLNARLIEAQRSGRLVINAIDISFAYGDQEIVDGLSTTIMRGDKVGIIGPNGCGKTTLLRLLLGEITPVTGSVRQGTRLEIAYFDQLRAQLDETKTVKENVVDHGDMVFANQKPRHIIGYLKDFLFSPDQAASPVRSLSGGERNRLLLARMFARPSNVLVLDEPTNDLDADTLDLLEARLIEYAGTVLMVSHDRAFLNNVVTSILAFEGGVRVREYVGGYDDWLRQRSEKPKPEPRPKKSKPRNNAKMVRKLTFRQKREFDELPGTIERLERQRRELFDALSDPELYRSSGTKVSGMQKQLDDLDQEISDAYARWEQLDELTDEADS